MEPGCEDYCEREVDDEVEWQAVAYTCTLAPAETSRRAATINDRVRGSFRR